MDDLEARLVEPLALGEVPREARGDRDVEVGEPADRAVRGREAAPVAERVEAVLRAREHRHAREPARGQAVEVGVDEVRVEDRGRVAAHERATSRRERDRLGGARAAAAARPGPRPLASRAANSAAPGSSSCSIAKRTSQPALAQRRQEEQQVVLGAGDPGDLGDVQDAARSSRELDDARGPALDRVVAHDRLAERAPDARSDRARGAARIAAASPSTSPCSNRSSGGSSVSKAGFDATTGRQVAAAS